VNALSLGLPKYLTIISQYIGTFSMGSTDTMYILYILYYYNGLGRNMSTVLRRLRPGSKQGSCMTQISCGRDGWIMELGRELGQGYVPFP
jgi:hypothetical protein